MGRHPNNGGVLEVAVIRTGESRNQDQERRVAIVGRLGVHPTAQLTLPARRIVAFLALQDEPITRSTAAGRLWPDTPETQRRSNLRRALWQVPDGWILSIGDALCLDADVDYPAAREVAARAIDGGQLTFVDVQLLSGDLLPGWHEEWVTAAQDFFRLLRVQALEAACRTMARAGQHALATQAGTAALAAEPLSESAADALISAHLMQGNRFAAARCFQDFRQVLRMELGVEPNDDLAARIDGLGLQLS